MQYAFSKRHAAASESRAPAGTDFSEPLPHPRIEPQDTKNAEVGKQGASEFSVLSVTSGVQSFVSDDCFCLAQLLPADGCPLQRVRWAML